MLMFVACDGAPRAPVSDSAMWNRFPRVVPNVCTGESCSTQFTAVACAEVRLSTAQSDAASLGPTVRLNDTVHVTQTDLHLEAPGVVVFRKAHVLEKEDHDGEPRPAVDTLRFVAGDTLYLLYHIGLGQWQAVFRGTSRRISDGFWFADPALPGRAGSMASDSVIAIARSYPKTSTWWHVSTGDGLKGFWKFDHEAWQRGLKPEGKYWEFDCQGRSATLR
jgi:hypothetical protein